MIVLSTLLRQIFCIHKWEPDRKAIAPSGIVGIKCAKCGAKRLIYESVRGKY